MPHPARSPLNRRGPSEDDVSCAAESAFEPSPGAGSPTSSSAVSFRLGNRGSIFDPCREPTSLNAAVAGLHLSLSDAK